MEYIFYTTNRSNRYLNSYLVNAHVIEDPLTFKGSKIANNLQLNYERKVEIISFIYILIITETETWL